MYNTSNSLFKNHINNSIFCLVLFFFVANFISSTVVYFMMIFYIFLNIINTKRIFMSENISYLLYYITICMFGFLVGLIGVLSINISIYNLLKDFFYHSMFIVIALFTLYFFKKYNFQQKKLIIYKSIIIFSVIHAIYYSISACLFFYNNNSFSINDFRMSVGTGGLVEVLSLVVLLGYNKRNYFFTSKVKMLFIILLLTSFLLQFSRTGLLALLLFSIPFFSIKYMKTFFRLFILSLLLLSFLYFVIPDIISMYVIKLINSIDELTSINLVWTNDNIVNYWRSYEKYLVIEKMSSAGFATIFFGFGSGMTIYTEYAYLVSSSIDSSLFLLHDGFFTIFFKTGIIGVIILLLMYFTMYKSIRNKKGTDKKVMLGLLLVMFFTSFMITGIMYSALSMYFEVIMLFVVLSLNDTFFVDDYLGAYNE